MKKATLIGNKGSPYSVRAEMALNLKGVEYEFIGEDLNNKSTLLLKHNPVHKKVPTLLHNGKSIAESMVIVEYVDETWECNHAILPKDPYERAMARFWAKFVDEKCIPAMWRACWSKGEERDKNKKEAIECLILLDNELKGKKYFGGDTIGLVDIVANFIAYWFGIIDKVVEIELITNDKLPNLSKWIDEYRNCSFVKEHLPPKDPIAAFFKAHIDNPDDNKYFPKIG